MNSQALSILKNLSDMILKIVTLSMLACFFGWAQNERKVFQANEHKNAA